eukprot:Phypoly_transcript_24693.p1 GENE.Phypoly_transcript_24693~~Phypoly_transcript_24693.p1  ORF type:complete len:157 (+),score=19.40 Phypoly_transcript_24693:41-472(+)
MRIVLFSTLVVLCLALLSIASGEESKEFHVRPGFDEEVTVSLGDRTCVFSYKCTGGTGEQWKITATDEEGPFTCYVGRTKPPSYLLFQSFSVSIKGATIGEAEVWDNSGVTLQDDQYVIDQNTVKPAKNWGGNLALAVLRAAQ